MWRKGFDTRDMARAFMMKESEIANRVPSILERARQDAEWNFDTMMQADRYTVIARKA